MQHTQRTLDEGEVQLVMQDVMRALEVYGARLRS
jgi:hypothetical protein